LSGTAPEYDRPWVETPVPAALTDAPVVDAADALLKLLGSPNYSSKAWIYTQYDQMVMADTVVRPGSDAGVVRIHGTKKAIAFTSDVTPRYCKANPYEGGKQAVAEAYRNLCATGAKPLATTDNLNFGNPEKPVIMGQFVGCIKGIGEAVLALNMPIVSGNVSLYNETDGVGILPTPTIGAVGLLSSLDQVIGIRPNAGDALILIGKTDGHLGQSALLKELFNREDGDAPQVDLAAEKRNGSFIRDNRDLIKACTDLSDGGLALAAFELAEEGGVGVQIDAGSTADLFGEDQARYLVACNFDQAEALLLAAAQAGVPIASVGRFTGDMVKLGGSEAALSDLTVIYRSSFAAALA